MRIAGPRRTPIGIDVGQRRVKAVQLSHEPGGWRVEAAADLPRTEPGAPVDPAQVRALREVLSRQGFAGRDVVLAVPVDKLLTGILEVPPRDSGAPIDQIARMELARIHRCQPDSLEIAYWDVPGPARTGQAPQGGRVMAVACAHAEAEPLLDAFEHEGLNVRALDVPACAIARACGPALAGDPAITCVVDMGWASARLFIFHLGTVVYERTLGETGVSRLFEELNRRLGLEAEAAESLLEEVGIVSAADARGVHEPFDELRGAIVSHLDSMVEELRVSFSYALHQYRDSPLERVLLIGGGAAIPGVDDRLSSVLDLDVRAIAPAGVADCPPAVADKCRSPALTAAAGLAQFVET